MLKECKLAVRVTHATYEPENGMVDNSTLTDALVMRAIFTYVRAHFGSPPDYDRLVEAYDTQKVQLMHASGYTDYGEEETEPEAEQPATEPAQDGDGA